VYPSNQGDILTTTGTKLGHFGQLAVTQTPSPALSTNGTGGDRLATVLATLATVLATLARRLTVLATAFNVSHGFLAHAISRHAVIVLTLTLFSDTRIGAIREIFVISSDV
jgi:hypothetical protein